MATALPATGKSITLLVRPSAARLYSPDEQAAENLLQAKITAVSFRGKYYQVWMQISGKTLMFELPTLSAEIGEQVTLALNPSAIELFAL